MNDPHEPREPVSPPPVARHSVMPLLPTHRDPVEPEGYTLLPTHAVRGGSIGIGVDALWKAIQDQPLVAIDGMPGCDFAGLVTALQATADAGTRIVVLDAGTALPDPDELDRRLAPYLGGDDPLFGRRCEATILELSDPHRLADLRSRAENAMRESSNDAVWVVGPGAAAFVPNASSVFLELPKNEIQYRARAGVATTFGRADVLPPKVAYKRSYFVDWPVFERHKADLLPRLDVLADAQRDEPTVLAGEVLRTTLRSMTRGPVRARPWFEPGAWGGQWMKRTIPGLPRDPLNYAWSFELISPENGLLLEHDGVLLELAWEWWMAHDAAGILGSRGTRFGRSFPIRFDFLDTVDGGNLSVQVHPRPSYIEREFGEPYTQDETYYIFDAEPDAEVYLGLQEGVTRERLAAALGYAQESGATIDVSELVQVHPAARHDLFLIPSGTIHCSGRGNLVLEISATPYIFTFKLYDWQRLDLDGAPRPLNVARGLDNVDFERSGRSVTEELVSKPVVIRSFEGGRTVHLPTHEEHFFDVHRHEFDTRVEVETHDSCHVLNLVEGERVRVRTNDGQERIVRYAETFVIPAAAVRFEVVNEGAGRAMLIDAFLKPNHG